MRLKAAQPPRPDTRDTIRQTAEQMFAVHGINGVSTRLLAERAGVNLAAINYHFGNKGNLKLDVFRGVARRTVRRRLDNLARIEAAAQAERRAPRIEDVVEAFVDAYVNADSPQSGVLLAHFVVEHRNNPTEWTRAIVQEELDGLALRYVAALRAAAPHLSLQDAHWRYHLMVSAIVLTLTDDAEEGRMARLSEGAADPDNVTEAREQLIAFLVGAFRQGG